jgi:hypothetical protein
MTTTLGVLSEVAENTLEFKAVAKALPDNGAEYFPLE